MTRDTQSPASPVADSSTFGHPEESADTETVPVLCESRRNTPVLDELLSVVVDTTTEDGRAGRPLYRLVLVILLLASGLLLDARRLGDAAALLMS